MLGRIALLSMIASRTQAELGYESRELRSEPGYESWEVEVPRMQDMSYSILAARRPNSSPTARARNPPRIKM